VGEKLQEKRLMKSLVDILRSQLERICYDFFDFAYVDDPKVTELFCTIKETCFSLVMSFYTYLYKVSFFSIREMDNLNDILEHNQALANIDTYKVECSRCYSS
jgi:hemoglobin-like flavoprotein